MLPVDTQPSLKTAWVNNGNYLSQFLTGYGSLTPKVGSYLVYQTPTNLESQNYFNYTNNIASTWNQYTIEGWIAPFNSVGSSSKSITIGTGVNGTNYINIIITPVAITGVDYFIQGVYYTGGTNTALTAASPIYGRNAWLYYAMVKKSNSERYLMINGSLVGTVNTNTFSEAPATTSGVALQFGYAIPNTLTQGGMPVLYDMHRISNIARYNSDTVYTPPTTLFTNDANTWYLSSLENTFTPAPSPT